ncbi:hypothetical protein AXG93_2909s1010 [Marchantia polymorpha subsp. ruderalis]|uniref:Uncharacterized protein n=1 Tax=Marchantia polymorpha subsp. ruderalis TaxID=1480154 RepID=A0A176WBM0_MARPO|nr:hypothetical protein AXG93_2909s1010 [Marchantia polymorpha subsp. ruderalis]
MAETKIAGIRQSRTRARPKKKTNRGRVVSDSSNSCVEKTNATALATDEENNDEPTLQVLEVGPLAEPAKVPTEVAVEPSEERMDTASPSFLSSEQTRSVGSEDVPQPKTSEELAKKLTLSEEILEQIVAQTQSVGSEYIPQLKRSEELAKKLTLSEEILKQIVAQVGGMVGDITGIPALPPPKEEVRSEVAEKTSEEGSNGIRVNREWDSATAMAKEQVASLTAECATTRATLHEQEDRLQAKEMECEALRLNLVKELDLRVTLEQDCSSLRTANENLHAKELAKTEGRRVEEARIAEDLWAQIAETKTGQEELRSMIAELANDRDKEFKRAEELTASLAEVLWKHEGELTDWAKKLAGCEAARSSEVECKLKVKLECGRLQEQLKRATLHLEESQGRAEKAKAAHRQSLDETTDEL